MKSSITHIHTGIGHILKTIQMRLTVALELFTFIDTHFAGTSLRPDESDLVLATRRSGEEVFPGHTFYRDNQAVGTADVLVDI